MQTLFTEHGYVFDDPSATGQGELSAADIYNLAFDTEKPDDAGLRFLVRIAKLLIDATRRDPDLALTRAARHPSVEDLDALAEDLPFCLGAEFVDLGWLTERCDDFAEVLDLELAAFDGTPEDYFKSKNDSLTVSGRVFFHLVETREELFPFAFMATYSTRQGKRVAHQPLKRALTEFKGDQKALLGLLGAVSRVTALSELITDLAESGELFSPLKFEPHDAYCFLREVPLYEECGIVCRIPDFWKRKAGSKLSLSLGAEEPATLGLASLIDFTPAAYIGDTELTRDELEALLAEDDGLAFLKGKWVEVNHARIAQVLAVLDRVDKHGSLSFAEALRLQAGITDFEADADGVETIVTNGAWLQGVLDKLRNPAGLRKTKPSKDFSASLRPYQQSGLDWLFLMRSLGFGALLADDMGLGKTVQLLALLDKLRETGKQPKTLLVVPASLLVNWQKEAKRFAPKLRLSVVHGTGAKVSREAADLFVTTYGMVSRVSALTEEPWDIVVLDEAQAIKNPAVKQTKAIKSLDAGARIAMTGTPIENRLSDLWSLFDFLNPGLLGSPKEFKSFTSKLKESPGGYAKLRGAVSPFILRRLKTDKSVISDLPEKSEIKQFTTLAKKQVVLYSALVKELEHGLLKSEQEGEATGMARRGMILAAIMKFKQICNHPDHYVGQGAFDPKQSGKFGTLAGLCETIRDKHESVLVFTQFREMCTPLSDYLEDLFGRPGLEIHGGLTPKKRGAAVEQFNNSYVPFMVLSLKAGGVGLNLTAANHVVHFDRWWNPAIEDQATDRAFRIGQTKDVMVHKFVTTGTVEEKIDAIIESKTKLARDVIAESTGESWVTEMTNSELLSLFRLEA
ncbi:MAG: DEAD/DEAH box helicase [Coriobacteriales bacterium]|jgi:non-specific serine/threonine protein kinase|nr:DEAD/DEAH box helicase [Coriobacteriales bacterium]